MSQSDSARQLLRHTLATLAYRACKAVRGAPDSFAEFHASRRCTDARANSGSHRRSSGLGFIDRARPAAMARIDAASLAPGSAPLLCRAGSVGRLSGFGQPASHYRPKSCFKRPSPMRSRISDRSRCCGGWRARRCARKIITSRKSQWGPWAPISPRRCTSFRL